MRNIVILVERDASALCGKLLCMICRCDTFRQRGAATSEYFCCFNTLVIVEICLCSGR